MAYFIHRSDVPGAVRLPHLTKRRRQLRQRLFDPALSEEQREAVLNRIERIDTQIREAKSG